MGKSSTRNRKNVIYQVVLSVVSTRQTAKTQEGRKGQELYVCTSGCAIHERLVGYF